MPANANALIQEQAKGLISFREAEMLQAADPDERAARLAELATPRSIADRLPSRELLLWQFAGTAEQRNEQIDRAFPGLAAQERDETLRTARQLEDGPKRRTAIIAAHRLYQDRVARRDRLEMP